MTAATTADRLVLAFLRPGPEAAPVAVPGLRRQRPRPPYLRPVVLAVIALTALIVGYSRASPVTPGNITYNAPGIYPFTVPAYNSITFTFWGPGGRGGHPFQGGPCTDNAGTTSAMIGGVQRFATGGHPGSGTTNLNPGAGGVASGGNVANDPGNPGTVGTCLGGPACGGKGGDAPGGGAGGTVNSIGAWPGGGGGAGQSTGTNGSGGGSGARMIYTAAAGVLTPGSTISIAVGNVGSVVCGSAGAVGGAFVSWSYLLDGLRHANDATPAWLPRAA